MSSAYNEVFQFSVEHLRLFLPEEGLPAWFGPYSYVVVEELAISIGPFRPPMFRNDLLCGELTKLPQKSAKPLVNGAFLHPEIYCLTKAVVSDLLLRPQILPEELRIFASLALSGQALPPKTPKLSHSKVPSPTTFARDLAICRTLSALERNFGLTPTENKEKRNRQKSTGAAIVRAAVNEIGYPLGMSSINNIWSKRQNFEELSAHVGKELAKAPQSIPAKY